MKIRTIQEKIKTSFNRFDNRTAVECGSQTVTYSQLERQSAAVARWIAARGIPAGTFIGIEVEQQVDFIIALLGILGAGCVFVPLDPSYPASRIRKMIAAVGLEWVIGDENRDRDNTVTLSLRDILAEETGSSGPDRELPGILASPEDKIYVYFTSGSTGTPRAVLGKNKSLCHFIDWEIDTFGVDGSRISRVSQLTNVGFDAFLRDLFVPLCAGGVVCIPESDEIMATAGDLIRWLERRRIHLIHTVPSFFRTVLLSGRLHPGALPDLHYVMMSGERIYASDLEPWYAAFDERIHLVNFYGPTETTMIKTYYRIGKADLDKEIIPVGKPMRGARVVILDEDMEVCDPLEVGELYIRTPFRTFGYYNEPELNRQRFIPNPLSGDPGDLIYRTGDLARLLPDGNIELRGRVDFQVKVRGNRVEPGEIETWLLRHESIEAAVVTAADDSRGESYLSAYIVARDGLTPSHAKAYLAINVPAYMIPAYIVLLDKMPLLPNGKVDRRSLPEPLLQKAETYEPPRDALESTLVHIWAGVLESVEDRIGVDDDFFRIGGQSLRATTMLSRIHRHLEIRVPLGILLKSPTIRGLAHYIRETRPTVYRQINPAETKEYYPLSSAQKRLYFLHLMEAASTYYNMPFTLFLPEDIETRRLEEGLNRLIARHESLRTCFTLVGEEPVQRICKPGSFTLEHYRSGDNEAPAPDVVMPLVRQFIRPFDLSRAPLFRVGLVTGPGAAGGTFRLLMFDMHHIITDGTSHEILERDFAALYRGETPEPLKLQYKDFACWQQSGNPPVQQYPDEEKGDTQSYSKPPPETINISKRFCGGSRGAVFSKRAPLAAGGKKQKKEDRQKSFWLNRLSGEITVLELPYDFPRPVMQSFAGERINFMLEESETGLVRALARRARATLFMTMLTLFNILLYKLSQQEDIIIGTPAANRLHPDLEPLIGMFVNTLVMRNYPTGKKAVSDFLAEVKKSTADAYDNQEYPFEELVDAVSVKRDTGRNPLFDVMFVLQNFSRMSAYHPGRGMIGGSAGYENIHPVARFDLVFQAIEREKDLACSVEYCTKLFKRSTIQRFIGYFKKIAAAVGEDPEQELGDIDILEPAEREAIMRFSQGPQQTVDPGLTIHRLFEQVADQVPLRTAVTMKGENYTYGELNRRANQLAVLLREKGVKPDTLVGLMTDRSFEMIAALLGILKAGGAYVPIDPAYPQKRIAGILEDSRVSILITRERCLDSLPFSLLQTGSSTRQPDQLSPMKILKTRTCPQIQDFDSLPLPNRTLVDYQKYHRQIGIAMAKHTVSIQATRGCPFNCAFCHKVWPKRHVVRSADHIFSEIRQCYDAGVSRFVFIDDIFNLDTVNSSRLLEKIAASGLDLQLFFPNGLRGDILTPEFIDLMVCAGTVNIDLALESASPRIQKLINKNLNLEKLMDNARYLTRKYPRVMLEMELMTGFPTETTEEALMTLEFLKELKWVHFPNLNITKIYPNTDMYRIAVENGVNPRSIEASVHLAYHELPETLPFPKVFVKELQSRFLNEYFFSRERLLHVLPLQARHFTREEMIRKYDSYLPMEIRSLEDILEPAGVTVPELGEIDDLPPDYRSAPDFNRGMERWFPVKPAADGAFRILLIDTSLLFSDVNRRQLYDMVEEPLGLMYLVSYLETTFGEKVRGKVVKSRMDFEGYGELYRIISEFNPHLIGIRTLSYYRDFFHSVAYMIKQWGFEVPVIAGGPYATSDYQRMLQDPYIDLAVLGEGEHALANLVEQMMANRNRLPRREVLVNLPGIAFIEAEPPGHREPISRREIVTLDRLPVKFNALPGENLTHVNSGSHLAYMIYTSGSTGKPKGVMLEHRNLVNLMEFQLAHTSIDNSRILQFATISFDASFHEIFSALLSGGQLVLVDKETRSDIPALFRVMEQNQVKTVFLPMSFLKIIFSHEPYIQAIPRCLTHIQTAGEQVVISESFRSYLKSSGVFLHNHYGPSETHVITALTLDPAREIPEIPSIGYPLLNTGIYILDRSNRPVPLGVPGELCAGGIMVGRGYYRQPGLTGEKFFPNPLIQGDRLYRTGDLARWLPDGQIHFLGRIDHQVKIRGFRVEPQEIETHLAEHDDIREAIVLLKVSPGGEKSLCAYVTSKRQISGEELRDYLGRRLPDYMIPAHFLQVEKIPLTPNGKVDRTALLALEVRTGNRHQPPRNAMEQKLVEIWAEVLEREGTTFGIDADFFQLGGHSLNLIRLVARIYRDFGEKIGVEQIFKTPRIKDLAGYLMENRCRRYSEEDYVLLNAPGNPAVFGFPPGIGYGLAYQELASFLPGYSVYAFNFIEAGDRIARYIRRVTACHPGGPLVIFGYSAGGNLAFEVAKALEAAGRAVSALVLLDTHKRLGDNQRSVSEMEEILEQFDRKINEYTRSFGLEYITGDAKEKNRKFLYHINELENHGTLAADIHLIVNGELHGEDGVRLGKHPSLSSWQEASTGQFKIYRGCGTHADMLIGENLEKNAAIVKRILDQIPF